MATMTNSQEQAAPISKLWWVALVAGIVSVIANVIVYYVAGAFGETWTIPDPSGNLAPMPVFVMMIASFIPAIGAGALLWVLDRFTSRPFMIFWIVSAVFLIASFALPFVNLPPEVAFSTRMWLNFTHIVAAAAIVGVLSTLGREQ